MGVCSMCVFLYLGNSQEIRGFVLKVNSSNTTVGIGLIVAYRMATLILLLLGLALPAKATYQIIQRIKYRKKI